MKKTSFLSKSGFKSHNFLLIDSIKADSSKKPKKFKTFAEGRTQTRKKEVKIAPKSIFIKSPLSSNKESMLFADKPSFEASQNSNSLKIPLGGPSHAPINLLNQIRILIKAANIFRFRTKFRNMKFLKEDQAKLFFDQAYFPEPSQKQYFLKRFTEKNVNFKK